MIKKLKPKSEFSRNVLTLMTGTTIAQAIPIAVSPILTRIYTPEDFGILALYVAIASILSAIVSGQYELAIMLPRKDSDALGIAVLSIIITVSISFIMFFIILLFNEQITHLLGNEKISNWLYFIPLTVLLTGVYNNLNYWLSRNKKYKTISHTKVYQSVTVATSNITLGALKYSSAGLIIGNIFGQTIATLNLMKKVKLNKASLNIEKVHLFALAKRYSKFPKISVPHSVFNALSLNMPIFIITYYFSSKETGYFSFATKIVMLPISLVSHSYYQVFFQTFSKKEDKKFFFIQKFKQVNIIFLPIFTSLWFVFPNIFAFIFGNTWKVAGVYTQVLLPLFYLKLLSSIFASTAYIYYEKLSENFILGVVRTILIVTSLLVGVYYQSIILGLTIMSITHSIVIIYKLYRSFVFIEDNKHAK